MNTRDIIRAWKDEQFRKNLNSDQQALLPAHPAGEIALAGAKTDSANGGMLLSRIICRTDNCMIG